MRAPAIGLFFLGAFAAASCAGAPTSGRAQGVATSGATFLHTGLGAGPAVFTGSSGAVVEERRSDPFGELIDDADLSAHDLNPLNKRSDVATGWSDHGARWMAPEIARWLTPDPPVTGPDPSFMERPWALHPYQYVEQNPIVFWDPDGRQPARLPSAPAPCDVACRLARQAQQRADIRALRSRIDGIESRIAAHVQTRGTRGSTAYLETLDAMKSERDVLAGELRLAQRDLGGPMKPDLVLSVNVGTTVSFGASGGSSASTRRFALEVYFDGPLSAGDAKGPSLDLSDYRTVTPPAGCEGCVFRELETPREYRLGGDAAAVRAFQEAVGDRERFKPGFTKVFPHSANLYIRRVEVTR